MRREWIEMSLASDAAAFWDGLPPCGGSGLKYFAVSAAPSLSQSPSMRREWIEMDFWNRTVLYNPVSLHAEGVD